MLYVDGVFDRHAQFFPVREPSAEAAYLDLQTDDDDAMATIVGASISYRIAFGPNAGKKALTLQMLPHRRPAATSKLRNKVVPSAPSKNKPSDKPSGYGQI